MPKKNKFELSVPFQEAMDEEVTAVLDKIDDELSPNIDGLEQNEQTSEREQA